MSKTIVYFLFLALLGCGAWFFLFSDRDIFSDRDAGFKITDTSAIDKIFIADKSGNNILLERTNAGWKLNKNYTAIPAQVGMLMKTLYMQAASYPVPESMHNTVVSILATNGVKVELYNNSGKKFRTFYVGGQANGLEGTYMLMEGAKKPYVVQIPGFEGYISPRYSTDITDWRDRTVFNIPPQQLKTVRVQYVIDSLNSFILSMDDTGKITVAIHPELMKGKELNKRRATVYSRYFENIYAEGYINGVLHLDSIIRSVPKICVIDVEDKEGKKQHLEVYRMPINKRSKNRTFVPASSVEYDADRFFATMNEFRDTVIIQNNTFDKIFQYGYEFYQADDTSSQLQVSPQNDARAGVFKLTK